jgi:hypothetical protein
MYRRALTQPQYGNANLRPFGLWRSLVARSVRVGEVAGSNPVSPIPRPLRMAPHTALQHGLRGYSRSCTDAIPTQTRKLRGRKLGIPRPDMSNHELVLRDDAAEVESPVGRVQLQLARSDRAFHFAWLLAALEGLPVNSLDPLVAFAESRRL